MKNARAILWICLLLAGFLDMQPAIAETGTGNDNALVSQPQDTVPLLATLTTQYFQSVEARAYPEEQIRIIQEILKYDPGSATFWFYLGVQYKLVYQFRQAIDAFVESLEKYSSTAGKPVVQIYDYLGYCYHALGYYREEMKVYEAGRNFYPDHPALIGRQAICYYSQGRIRDADRLLEKYSIYWEQEGHSEAEILHSLGILFLETDDIKAERYFRSALNGDPENSEFGTSLARVLILMGVRMDEALNILQEAIREDPDNPTLLHLLGWAYFRLEEYSDAHDLLSRAEELYPEYNHNLILHLDKTKEILSVKLFNSRDR